jgi:HSP20 family protein
MALQPARRSGSLPRPGSQRASRPGPRAWLHELCQPIAQLMPHVPGRMQPARSPWAPTADLSETGDAYIAEVELPGIEEDRISVGLVGRELVIAGELTGSARAGRVLRRAWRTGRFACRVPLPGQADCGNVTAWLADGVLTVTIPKAEPGKPLRT